MTEPTWRQWYAEHRKMPPIMAGGWSIPVHPVIASTPAPLPPPTARLDDDDVDGIIIDKTDNEREIAQRLLDLLGSARCKMVREAIVDLTWD